MSRPPFRIVDDALGLSLVTAGGFALLGAFVYLMILCGKTGRTLSTKRSLRDTGKVGWTRFEGLISTLEGLDLVRLSRSWNGWEIRMTSVLERCSSDLERRSSVLEREASVLERCSSDLERVYEKRSRDLREENEEASTVSQPPPQEPVKDPLTDPFIEILTTEKQLPIKVSALEAKYPNADVRTVLLKHVEWVGAGGGGEPSDYAGTYARLNTKLRAAEAKAKARLRSSTPEAPEDSADEW